MWVVLRILSPTPLSQAYEDVIHHHEFEFFDPDENDSISVQLDGLPSWLEASDDNLTISGTPTWQDYNSQESGCDLYKFRGPNRKITI